MRGSDANPGDHPTPIRAALDCTANKDDNLDSR